jgi:hypothetical protein
MLAGKPEATVTRIDLSRNDFFFLPGVRTSHDLVT